MIWIRAIYRRQAKRFLSGSKTSNLQPWLSNRPITRAVPRNNVSIGIVYSEVLWIPLRGRRIFQHRTPGKNTWIAWQSTWTGSTLASPSQSFTRQHATQIVARGRRCISALLPHLHHNRLSTWIYLKKIGWPLRSKCARTTYRSVPWRSYLLRLMNRDKPAALPSENAATIQLSWIRTLCLSFTKWLKVRFGCLMVTTFASRYISHRPAPRHQRLSSMVEMPLLTKTHPSA